MTKLERLIGASICRHKGKRTHLDELPPDVGRYDDEPKIECGIFCELAETELEGANHG